MRRTLAFGHRRGQDWVGKVPFLAAAFALTGRGLSDIPVWLGRYRGRTRPQDDIADYLAMEFGVGVGSLATEANSASIELRGAIQEIWYEAHERRRGLAGYAGDMQTTARLVEHDVENYLGVIVRRKSQKRSSLGYTTWWLTLDRTAYQVRGKLREQLANQLVPDSPVISPDFMVNYLAIGPIRSRIAKETESGLPLSIAALPPLDLIPKALLDAAEEIRSRMTDLPEHVIRREVRDTLDRERRRTGALTEGGLDLLMQELSGAMSSEE